MTPARRVALLGVGAVSLVALVLLVAGLVGGAEGESMEGELAPSATQPPFTGEPDPPGPAPTAPANPSPPPSTAPPIVEDAGRAGPPTITVRPGDDLAALAATAPEGSTFLLTAGVHRPSTVVPRTGQSFVGQDGAVLTGAVELASFRNDQSLWVAEGIGTEGRRHGRCESSRSRCDRPEALFIDGELLRHVTSRAEVGAGAWFFDYDNDKVWIGEDPTGRRVELSSTPAAFTGTAADVTISGLVIERFAAPAQEGAIDSRRDTQDLVGGVGWVITDNTVRHNSGIGISATTGAVVSGNLIHHNGQLGVSAHGADITFRGNEIRDNNTADFERSWEAGGGKFTFTSGLVVEDNFVHDNLGVGLWTDIDNIDTTYRNNRVVDNERAGIFHEISYDATIVDNEVVGNGFGFPGWLWGGGIVVAASPNVEIARNTVTGNADGITAIQQNRADAPASYGALSVAYLSVHDNVIGESDGVTGIGQDVGSNAVYLDNNNRFFSNTYTDEDARFYWLNDERTRAEWEAFGQS